MSKILVMGGTDDIGFHIFDLFIALDCEIVAAGLLSANSVLKEKIV